jgi:hypothetical protein
LLHFFELVIRARSDRSTLEWAWLFTKNPGAGKAIDEFFCPMRRQDRTNASRDQLWWVPVIEEGRPSVRSSLNSRGFSNTLLKIVNTIVAPTLSELAEKSSGP